MANSSSSANIHCMSRRKEVIFASCTVAGLLLASVCGWCVAQPPSSIRLRTVNLYGVGVHIQYPLVIGTGAAALNLDIQHWIGGRCNESPVIKNTYMRRTTYEGAKDCLAAMSKECAALQSQSGSNLLAVGPCQAEIAAKVELDTAGLLVIGLYNFGSIERGFLAAPNESASVEYLNLDIATARALGLRDLLKPSYTAALQRMIAASLRAQSHVAASETLAEAGFLTDDPPIPSVFEILSEGIRFSYHAGEITAGSVAPPSVLVSYTQLSSVIREDGPLCRLVHSGTNVH